MFLIKTNQIDWFLKEILGRGGNSKEYKNISTKYRYQIIQVLIIVCSKQIIQLCNIFAPFPLYIQCSTGPLVSVQYLIFLTSQFGGLCIWIFFLSFQISQLPLHLPIWFPHLLLEICNSQLIFSVLLRLPAGIYSDHMFLSLFTMGSQNNLCTHRKPTINKVRMIR